MALDQKDPRILPDMGVRVSFLEQGAAARPMAPAVAGVLVPGSAVVGGGANGGGAGVYVVEDGVARAQAVTPGQVYGDLRAVTGLAAGVQVVRVPPSGMRAGSRVTLAPAGASQ